MYAVASVLCRTLQMSFNVDPGVRYLSVGPTISALASAGDDKESGKETEKDETFVPNKTEKESLSRGRRVESFMTTAIVQCLRALEVSDFGKCTFGPERIPQ
jgi:hypothetical protein